jgi:hypothetical protein
LNFIWSAQVAGEVQRYGPALRRDINRPPIDASNVIGYYLGSIHSLDGRERSVYQNSP